MQGGPFTSDELMIECLRFEASRDDKQFAFAKVIKTQRAKDFLLKLSGVEWEERSGSFVSPTLPRKEIFDLALSLPEDLFFQEGVGIVKSRSEGFRVMLDLQKVISASQDLFYSPKIDQKEQDQSTIKWENRETCVVSQPLSWHEALNYASKINENLFLEEGPNVVGIVKSSIGGFRVILDPYKFAEISEHDIWKKRKIAFEL